MQSLAGRVVDGRGTAVSGALVSVVSAASAWPRRYGHELGYDTVTDEEGRFAVEGLEPGSYDVTARLMGWAPGELRDVAAGRKDLVLTLAQGTRLVGTVRDAATGKPMPSFTLAVFTKRGPLQREGFAPALVHRRAGPLRAGRSPGGELRGAGGRARLRPIRGQRGGAERGLGTGDGGRVARARSEDDGARGGGGLGPPAGARAHRRREPGHGRPLSVRYDALTDAQGNFTLDGLPTGQMSLYVSAEGHHSRIISGIHVSPEGTPPQLLELRKTEEGEEPQLELVGIGAVLAAREDALVVGQVFPGGGAAEAGLATGDGIVRINGRPVVELGFVDAIQSIRGAEGSKLVLGVRKAPAPGTGESPAPVVDITVTRRRIRQ